MFITDTMASGLSHLSTKIAWKSSNAHHPGSRQKMAHGHNHCPKHSYAATDHMYYPIKGSNQRHKVASMPGAIYNEVNEVRGGGHTSDATGCIGGRGADLDDSTDTICQIESDLQPMIAPDMEVHNSCSCCGGSMWCIKDICGYICVILTWMLMFYSQFVVMFVILVPNLHSHPVYAYVNMVVYEFLAILAIASHLRTMLTDPGAVPKGNATSELIKQMTFQEGQVVFKCAKCCSIKPERAHHCSVCQRCIRKMDHHCPWVNNCVGENNQKYFVLFTLYIASISVHSLALASYEFIFCIRTEWRICSSYTPPATVVLLLFLIVEALVFSVFTLIMFGTQLNAIWNDETGIEQLKKEQAQWERRSRWKSIQAVFGRFSLLWLSPFTPSALSSRSAGNHLYSV